VMNPGAHTYWKLVIPDIPPQAMAMIGQMQPKVSVIHTGEMMTIAGVQVEHVAMTTSMNLPIPAGAPGVPSTITTSLDLWVAEQYAGYSASAAVRSPISTMLGIDRMQAPGFVMRSVMRNSMLPGFEIESIVTKIAEEPAPADAFQIPADYTEVSSPFQSGPAFGGRPPIGGAQAPVKLIDMPPVYPPEAQAARVQGVVILEVMIGADGHVTDARVLRSIPELDQAAIDAVRQWVYSPTFINGQPAPVIITVTVNFTLR
jgi:TonB family protein